MIRNLLGLSPESADLAIFVLLLFFSIFVGIVVWAVFANKKYIERMKQLPLEPSNHNGDKND